MSIYQELLPQLPAEDYFGAMRAALLPSLREAVPVDFMPGSVSGDAVATPIFTAGAILDEGVDRLISDMLLTNPSEGIIYSCEFVRDYIKHLGVYDLDSSPPRGTLRITLSSDEAAIYLNRKLRFRFDDGIWQLRVNDSRSDGIVIRTSYDSPGGVDDYVRRADTPNSWVVDVPVWAPSVSSLPRVGDLFAMSESNELILRVEASYGFVQGVGPATLKSLVNRAAHIFASASLQTKNGARAYFFQHWADSVMVSPILPSDPERPAVSGDGIALPPPSMDIYYRSASDMSPFTDTVKLYYVDNGEAMVLRGPLRTAHRPAVISGLSWGGDASHISAYTVFAYNEAVDPDFFGSTAESLWVEAQLATDELDIPTLTLEEDEGGTYAWIQVSGLCDPHADTVRREIESPDNAPPGVALRLRQGPVTFVNLFAQAKRLPGAYVNHEALRNSVAAYFLSVGSPAVFGWSSIHKIFRDHGLHLMSLGALAETKPSAAATLIARSVDPRELTDDWYAGATAVTPVNSSGIEELIPAVPYVELEDSSYAATSNTVRMYLNNLEVMEA